MRRRALLEQPGSNGRTATQSEIGHGLAALVLDNGGVFGGGKEAPGVIAPGTRQCVVGAELGDRARVRH